MADSGQCKKWVERAALRMKNGYEAKWFRVVRLEVPGKKNWRVMLFCTHLITAMDTAVRKMIGAYGEWG